MRTTETTIRPGRSLRDLRLAVCALAAVLLSLTLLTAFPAQAQDEPDMGTIPGTSMRRDEFRGRAMAQLSAIALNALTYQLANGEYPKDFAHLRGSDAWNIDVTNMFSGQRLRSIYFEPQPGDLTSAASNGFVPSFDVPPGLPPDGGQRGSGGGSTEPGGSDIAPGAIVDIPVTIGAQQLRVDPQAIKDIVPGDVFYYVQGELLQLIIYAPDRTYVEWVDEVPNVNFREGLSLSTENTVFPADLYSLQVLYYTEELLPEYLGLFRFMADRDSPPQAALQALSAAERLPLAQEFGVTVLNPLTHQPAAALAQPSPGDFVLADGSREAPLLVYLSSGKVAMSTDLRSKGALTETAPADQGAGKVKPPKAKPSRPKVGGGRPAR